MIEIGIKGTNELLVTYDVSAKSIGSGTALVLATPMMIALIENTCMNSVSPYLSQGQTTVGTLVNVKHLAATPIGLSVTCNTELVEVDRRRLLFKVSIFDVSGLVGEGLHERFIVDEESFQAKADAKMG